MSFSDTFTGEDDLRPFIQTGQCQPSNMMPDNLYKEKIQRPGIVYGPCNSTKFIGHYSVDISQEVMVGTHAYIKCEYLAINAY